MSPDYGQNFPTINMFRKFEIKLFNSLVHLNSVVSGRDRQLLDLFSSGQDLEESFETVVGVATAVVEAEFGPSHRIGCDLEIG